MASHLAPTGAGLGGVTRAEARLGGSVLGGGQATRTEAGLAAQVTGQVRHGKAATCVTEDQHALLAFCDLPAEH